MATDTSGFYKGRHYTTFVDEVKALKRAGDYSGAEVLLLALLQATENEARANRWAVAPWYYDQLAIIYRKTKQSEKEFEVLKRYASFWNPKDGPLPAATVTAIEKARQRIPLNATKEPPEPWCPREIPRFVRRTTCTACGFEHEGITRCPRCGAPRE